MTDDDPLVWTDGLTKYYDTGTGFIDSLLGRSQQVKAVDGVDLELYDGETLGVVGESGCGKSTLGQALLRLVEPTDGSVYYRGEDLTTVSSGRLRELRTDLQYIFQDPFSSLNPRLTVGDIIGEPLDIHDIADGAERTERIYELLETVGLNPRHTSRYPHEFSGGQRQRIGIARALAVDPEVIVCDEPVSALDVSVQAQILNLLGTLQDELGLSYIFIAHDLSVVEHISDRVAVMYLGEFAETGTTEELFAPPHHPYTEALLSAIPEPDPLWAGAQIQLSGSVPSPIDPPSGCRFHTRCPRIIQPDEFDLDQDVWRSMMNLKQRLRTADEVASLTAVDDSDVASTKTDGDGGSLSTDDGDGGSLSTDDGDGGSLSTDDGTGASLSTDDDDRADQSETDATERDRLERRLRREFDLPEQLTDPQLDRLLSRTADRLHDDQIEEANEQFADVVGSPCERINPELRPPETETGAETDTHRIACLLYQEWDRPPVTDSAATEAGDTAADD